MKTFLPDNSSAFFLFGTVLLLPLAQLKVSFFGLPVYLPELSIVLALVSMFAELFLLQAKTTEKFLLPDRLFFIGVGLFLVGALISFVVNPFSLTGLGMLKSWFFFPAVFGYLLWRETVPCEKRRFVLMLWLLAMAGIAARSLSSAFQGVFTFDGRLVGDYPSPNFLAFVLAPAIPVACYFSFFEPLRPWERRFSGVVLGGVIWVLLLTHSYGAWLGVAGSLLVLFFRGRRPVPFLFISAVLCVLFFAFEGGDAKWHALVSGDARSSLSSREMIWRSATKILSDHPMFGIGVGRFQAEYLDYQRFFSPYLEWAVPEPHNIFLAVALATGLIGLGGFLLLSGRLAILLWRGSFGALRSAEGTLNLLLLALFLLFFLMGLFDTPFFKNDLALQFSLLIALALPHPQRKKKAALEEAARVTMRESV